MAAPAIMHDNIWVDKFRVEDAELAYHQALANQRAGLVVQVKNERNPVSRLDGPVGQDLKTVSATNHCGEGDHGGSDLINEIVRARQNIKNSLNDGVGLKVGMGVDNPELQARLKAVEQENRELKKANSAIQASVAQLIARVSALEKAFGSTTSEQKYIQVETKETKQKNEDDDFDLFGDDDDDDEEEIAKLKEERQKEADDKKAKKKVIGKSTVIMDVKPWDDETDLAEMEKCVRSIEMTGLLWGASKVVPIAYGIKKLQISCVVVDDEVSTDDLENLITGFEDFVQSVDIVAFQKI